MIVYTTANSKNDLEGILKLQKANLALSLTKEEIQNQGFVTVDHSYDQLEKLNDQEKHVIAKDIEKVIGYLLAMTKRSRFDIPVPAARGVPASVGAHSFRARCEQDSSQSSTRPTSGSRQRA